jgi:hypothetical protein
MSAPRWRARKSPYSSARKLSDASAVAATWRPTGAVWPGKTQRRSNVKLTAKAITSARATASVALSPAASWSAAESPSTMQKLNADATA